MALALGTALGLVLCGGLVLVPLVGIEGTQRCDTCGASRKVRFAGLLHSDSRPDAASSSIPCAEHDWRRRGCWKTFGGYANYGT